MPDDLVAWGLRRRRYKTFCPRSLGSELSVQETVALLPRTRRKPRDRRADLQAWPTPTTCGLCSPNLTTAPLGSRPSALGNCSHDNQPSTPKTGRAMSIAAESRVTVSCLVAPVTRDPTTRSCEMPGTEQQQQHTMCNSRGATYLDAQLLLRIHPRSGEDESGLRATREPKFLTPVARCALSLSIRPHEHLPLPNASTWKQWNTGKPPPCLHSLIPLRPHAPAIRMLSRAADGGAGGQRITSVA